MINAGSSQGRRVSVGDLLERVGMTLEGWGMSAVNAAFVARVVVDAERDGALSHGLFRLPGYRDSLRAGWVDGWATPVVSQAAPGVLAVDGANGFAQPALGAVHERLIEMARAQGIAMFSLRNSHHFAALWTDLEPFAREGLVAIGFVNARSRITVWDAHRKLFGTNPMAFAFPRSTGLPVVWDQASSVMAQGEVLLAAKAGHRLADGVGRDAAGRPTNDPRAVLDGGAIEPFAGHKGSAIALMVEVMAAALSGGRFGFEDRSADYPGAQTSNAGQCLILIDPGTTNGDFAVRIDQLLAALSESGVSRLPADRRYRTRALSEADGIVADLSHLVLLDAVG